jgi:hypothetical protein
MQLNKVRENFGEDLSLVGEQFEVPTECLRTKHENTQQYKKFFDILLQKSLSRKDVKCGAAVAAPHIEDGESVQQTVDEFDPVT